MEWKRMKTKTDSNRIPKTKSHIRYRQICDSNGMSAKRMNERKSERDGLSVCVGPYIVS